MGFKQLKMNIERVTRGIETWLFPIIRVVDYVTWITLFSMMLMTMTDVLLRKFTNISILGTVELTELMMVIVIFCSLAQCEVNEGHIKVDLVFKRFPLRMQLIVDTFTQFLCCGLFAVMAWATYRHAVNVKEWGEITFDLGLPLYPFVYVASFGCFLLALVLLFKTLLAFNKVVTA